MKNIISVLALFLGLNAFGATYCVGPSATGTGSGADWNNTMAWSSTPSRGDIWYLKDGTYPGKILSTANSGTSLITIKKAIGAIGQTGHGTDSGWNQSTMGSGQATITDTITVNSSYWVIDGQKGAGFSVLPPDTNAANYGIAMTSGFRCVSITPPAGNITVSHCYGAQANNDTSAGSGWFVGSLSGSGTVDSVTVSHCLMVLWGQGITATYNAWNNLVFEYNCYWTIYASSAAHANPINASYGDINNATVRYNLFYQNVPGTWGFSQVIAANNANWNAGKIYGNVFDHCWAGRSIISGNGRANDAVYDLLVYNNTFLWSAKDYPNDGGGLIGDEISGRNTFINNLAFSCNASVGSVSSHDYNEYVATHNQPTESHGVIITGSYNPFTNPANQLYSLITNTPAGTPLGVEFSHDALGNTRTTWSRGAFEYNGSPSTNPVISVSPSSLNYGPIVTNTTANLSFTVQNIGGDTLRGTATVSAPFAIISNASYTLGSGQSQIITVQFAPSTLGTATNVVTFTATGGNGTNALVSGTGSVNPAPAVSAISANASDIAPSTSGFQIYGGSVVQLSATATNALTYQWNYTINGGSPVIYQSGSGAVSAVNFTYGTSAVTNTYVWTLTVSNGQASAQSQFTLSVVPPPAVTPGLVFAAGSGTITSPFVLANTVTNGVTNSYFYQPIQTTVVTNGGSATYNFITANAGNYVIQALVNAPNGGANSFFVNIDAQPQDPTMIWDVTLTSGFEQRLVSWRGTGTYDADQFVPKVFNLTAGSHQLIIVGLEANTQLSSFSILQVPQPPTGLHIGF